MYVQNTLIQSRELNSVGRTFHYICRGREPQSSHLSILWMKFLANGLHHKKNTLIQKVEISDSNWGDKKMKLIQYFLNLKYSNEIIDKIHSSIFNFYCNSIFLFVQEKSQCVSFKPSLKILNNNFFYKNMCN
jgi:hypothetical protein